MSLDHASKDPAAFTLVEFCKVHPLSRGALYKMRGAGTGPRTMCAGSKVPKFDRKCGRPASRARSRGRRSGEARRVIMTNRTSKPPRSPRAEPPLEAILKSARELDCRERLLTPRDAANLLRLSLSWLAKARMRGDGPPYVKLGRAIRYSEGALVQWMKSRLRLSTSDQ